jgi:TPR repeat protein
VVLSDREIPVGALIRVVLVVLYGLLVARLFVATAQDQAPAPQSAGRTSAVAAGAEAESGDPSAQFKMGVRYELGDGVPQDYAQAAVWYRKAADQGRAHSEATVLAQFALAVLYERGQGVPQNYAQAASWYRKAADRDHRGAQAALSVLHTAGKGVPQDLVAAHMWLNIAASRSSGAEHTRFAEARDTLAARMTPEQIAEAQRRASAWRPVEAGH